MPHTRTHTHTHVYPVRVHAEHQYRDIHAWRGFSWNIVQQYNVDIINVNDFFKYF